MNTRVDPQLRQEAQAFSLRFSCEDCCHRVDDGPALACSMAYPVELLRRALDDETLAFCKSFELA